MSGVLVGVSSPVELTRQNNHKAKPTCISNGPRPKGRTAFVVVELKQDPTCDLLVAMPCVNVKCKRWARCEVQVQTRGLGVLLASIDACLVSVAFMIRCLVRSVRLTHSGSLEPAPICWQRICCLLDRSSLR